VTQPALDGAHWDSGFMVPTGECFSEFMEAPLLTCGVLGAALTLAVVAIATVERSPKYQSFKRPQVVAIDVISVRAED
jgi:hypothetical protein